jgi:hypothetical protein
MDQEDLPIKPGIFVRGSISPAGASNSTESENCERSRVVVWCAQREKFLRPCTTEFICLPVCVCTPMLRFLFGGQMDRTQA